MYPTDFNVFSTSNSSSSLDCSKFLNDLLEDYFKGKFTLDFSGINRI